MSQIRSKQIYSNNTGDLLVGDSNNFEIVGIGTTGQVLTVSGGTVSWASPSVPDAFTYLGTVNAANALIPQVAVTPATGDYYAVTATGNTENFAGTWDANSSAPFIGATFLPGDSIVYNGTTWDKFENNNSVVVGTTNQIDVSLDSLTNTYTVSIDANYVGQTSITTLGTITSGTWNATPIARQFGGTGGNTTSLGANQIFVASSSTTTSGIVAPTVSWNFLGVAWLGFVWAPATDNSFSTIGGNSGSVTASVPSTINIIGSLGVITAATSGSPDTLTIETSINSGSALYNNVGAGSVQLGIQGATVGTILQANGTSSEATWTSFTLPTSVGSAVHILN